MLHKAGYTVKDLPSIHLGEQRRILEGRLEMMRLEQRREMAKQGLDPEKEQMKQNSKDRARQRFMENRGIA